MYLLALFLLLAAAAIAVGTGILQGRRGRVAAGVTLGVGTAAFFGLMSFYGEMLWFESLSQAGRFWRMVGYRASAIGAGALFGWVSVRLLTRSGAGSGAWIRHGAALVGLVAGALWGAGAWNELVLAWHRVPAGVSEPILGRDASFYLFVLPLLQEIAGLLVMILIIAAAGLASRLFTVRGGELAFDPEQKAPAAFGGRVSILGLALSLSLLLVLFVKAHRLLYSGSGVVTGPGWTDVHVRLPAYVLLGVVALLAGVAPWLPGLRGRLRGKPGDEIRVRLTRRFAPWAAFVAVWVLALGAAPALVQWLAVEPNEITYERPYIEHNIRLTRLGFGLDEIQERDFRVGGNFDAETARRNRDLLDEVRLWDWRALDSVYQQFQEIRLYYEFQDVDIDRYTIGGEYRQVMVSARELDMRNLPDRSQTFVNRRFKYTHGYGLTLAAVNEFTPDGLPNLLVKNLPPESKAPELEVTRPEIYYGELSESPALVNTSEREFDYPSGDDNVYVHYPGEGGVPIEGLWRRIVFGWMFDGTRLLLSGYPREGSRIQFHRRVHERLRTLAPFLTFEDDPYIVLAGGRLYWIVDAYTTSAQFPYSTPFSASEEIEYEQGGRTRRLAATTEASFDGVNYVRNSVKAVIDAYDGSVDLYVFEPEDPVLRTWRSAFPGLFRDRDEMPPELEAHVRYPQGLLLAQGLVYARYHMEDPEVFYNQEDLWIRATENYYGHLQPVEPYYILWREPDSKEVEFILMLPFTPKKRQVLIGWIAGLCDPPDYGKLLAYKFPKEKRVLGTQQVETKIDQDRHLAGQLTLWDQRGSRVIRGNVLAIPVDDTLLYVEPIYLQAETAAYPELRLVAVMHGDRLSYAPTFEGALQGLFDEGAGATVDESAGRPPATGVREIAREAQAAFDRYLRLQAEGEFERAGRALDEMRDALERLNDEAE